MLNISLSKDAKNFIAHLPKKHARQIVVKIKELSITGHAQDSKLLHSSNGKYFRVDSGEYRIVYQKQDDELLTLLVGKRNDNEIYKLFSRKKG